MMDFYKGKICVITGTPQSVNWAHILAGAVEPSNERLKLMLERQLREDKYPLHGAEVRENLVPLRSDLHQAMDTMPAACCLFLHEDIIARTLAYEQDLKAYRQKEVEAGRGDPGRPAYSEVFEGCQRTAHRWHMAPGSIPFMAYPSCKIYWPADCPGCKPKSGNKHPIVRTLLSIPFSLLHNLPRLVSMASPSAYHRDLVIMSQQIVTLWLWDPEKDMVVSDEPRDPLPCQIMERAETFEEVRRQLEHIE